MRLFTTTISTALLILGVTSLSSCRHKDVLYEEPLTRDVEIRFDWTNAPDANPESMAVYLFERNTGKQLRYIFTDRRGGTVNLPYGQYDAICMNADNTDWAEHHHTDDIERFATHTHDATTLAAQTLSVSTLPSLPSRADAPERVAQTPGMLYSDRRNEWSFNYTDTTKVFMMYPSEAVCHYTVTVIGAENIEAFDGTTIDATLSGMAEGFVHGQQAPTTTHSTLAFTVKADMEKQILYSEFLTFGEPTDNDLTHQLTLYARLDDGTGWYQTTDVTDQVKNAPDPTHVNIVIRNISLPRNVDKSEAGGFRADVNDWQTNRIDLPF